MAHRRLTALLSLLLLFTTATPALAKKPFCGDGIAQAAEACDQGDLRGQTCISLGYDAGTLTCNGDCTLNLAGCYDVVECGDGVIDTGEECDGSNLAGKSCLDFGFDGGSLACTADCHFDTSACTTSGACGNNLVEGYEECDGSADAACPGSCSAHCACPATAPTGILEIHVIDVGQGDAILVVSPDGFAMLVDSGEEYMADTVSSYIYNEGLNGLDYTLVTHQHTDHMAGMDWILFDYPDVTTCFDHGGACTILECDEYVTAAGERRTTLGAGDTIDLGSSMLAEVLHGHMGSANENDNSLVLRLTYGNLSFLLGGDCEAACEASFDPGIVEVYKVHHHGSNTSTTEGLMAQMAPYTALISLGLDNPYGYPHPEVLDRLAAYDTAVFRTDLDGNLVLIADGTTYTVNGIPVCNEGQTQVCGTTDVGACEYGTIPCVNGIWGSCQGAVYPADETCENGLDDDCDGYTDADDSDCSGGTDQVVISQVGYDTPGDDAVEEFVDLYNAGGTAVTLDGWTLTDNYGTWAIPTGRVIQPGAYLSIARSAAGFEALYGKPPDVSGMNLALGNTGDQLSLGNGVDEVDFVAWENYASGWSIYAGIGDSIERIPPTIDTDTVNDFSVTSPATPRGGTSSQCGDGACNGDESTASCPQDCGTMCGDGACNGDETAATCPADCEIDPCGDGYCAGSAAGETCNTCSADCGCFGPSCRFGCCGDGACGKGEDTTNCPVDCTP